MIMNKSALCLTLVLALGSVVPSSWAFAWTNEPTCEVPPDMMFGNNDIVCFTYFATWFQRLPQGTLAPTTAPVEKLPSASVVPTPSPTFGLIGRDSVVRQSVEYYFHPLNGVVDTSQTISTVTVELYRNDKCTVKIDYELCTSCELCEETDYATFSADCTNLPFGRMITCEPTQMRVDGEPHLFFPLTLDAPALQNPAVTPPPWEFFPSPPPGIFPPPQPVIYSPTRFPTTSLPTMASPPPFPTTSPTKQPLRVAPAPTNCGSTLTGCFLDDFSTGRKVTVLTLQATSTKGTNEYTLQRGSQYSVRCTVKGGAVKIKHLEFQYDGQTRRDFFAPWYMDRGTGIRGKKMSVSYLSNGCGTKEVVVAGKSWRGNTCFKETFILQAVC